MVTRKIPNRILKIKFSKIREVTTKVDEAKKKGIDIVNFSIGRPDFDTPAHIKEAAKKALDQGLVHYTASAGRIELREAICRRLQEDFQLTVRPEDILVTAGAAEAIYIGLMSVLNPGDEVLIPQPMYVYYEGYATLGGARPVIIPLREESGFLLKAKDVEKSLTDKTRLLILNSPHNPTGQVFEQGDLLEIANLAVKHDLIVVADDIYSTILYDRVQFFPIAKAPGMKERTLIVGSFSKSYAMDGWRIGYLIAPRELINGALKMHQHILSCPNTFVQVGAEAALNGSQDCVKAMVAEFDRRRRLLMSCLDTMKIPYIRPRGAFYIFPNISKFGMNSEQFSDFLLEKAHVAVVPGSAFGSMAEGFVRISYATSYESIEKGMERVRLALERL
jgi:aspartate/methionine/tyrosine aminotransferase